MCGRFAVGDTRGNDWADWLGVEPDSPWPAPSWNVAPTLMAGIVGEGKRGRSLVQARWGLVPQWWRKPLSEFRASTFNANSKEAGKNPMFRDAWRRGRCLLPVMGYYEGSGKAGSKQAYFISPKGDARGFAWPGCGQRRSSVIRNSSCSPC